jgi:MOSC domain-containing protein YiiM
MDLPHGMFGENFTIEGLLETDVNIGDRFRIGTAEFMATAPRLPCYKLGIKFGRSDIVKRLLVTRYTGFYFAVLREGEVQAGNGIERLERDETGVSVDDVVHLWPLGRIPQCWRGRSKPNLFRKAGGTTFDTSWTK